MNLSRSSGIICSALVFVLLTISSSFGQLGQLYSNSPALIKLNPPNLPTCVARSPKDGSFVAIASDDEGNWSFCSSKEDLSSSKSNMNHLWEQKAVFYGASLSRIAFKEDGLIITGRRDYKFPFLLISKDCGTNWIEEKPVRTPNSSLGSDDFDYSYEDVIDFGKSHFNTPVHFVSIGSDESEDQSSSFAIFHADRYVTGDTFIAIGSDSFHQPVDPFYPVGSDNTPAWYFSKSRPKYWIIK